MDLTNLDHLIQQFLTEKLAGAEREEFLRALKTDENLHEAVAEARVMRYLYGEMSAAECITYHQDLETDSLLSDAHLLYAGVLETQAAPSEEARYFIKQIVQDAANTTPETSTNDKSGFGSLTIFSILIAFCLLVFGGYELQKYLSSSEHTIPKSQLDSAKNTISMPLQADTMNVDTVMPKKGVLPNQTDVSAKNLIKDNSINNDMILLLKQADSLSLAIAKMQQERLRLMGCYKNCLQGAGASTKKEIFFTALTNRKDKNSIAQWLKQNKPNLMLYENQIRSIEQALKDNNCSCK